MIPGTPVGAAAPPPPPPPPPPPGAGADGAAFFFPAPIGLRELSSPVMVLAAVFFDVVISTQMLLPSGL